MKQRWIVGNWKMNGSLEKIRDFFKMLYPQDLSHTNIVICPPFPYLSIVKNELDKKKTWFLGAQKCCPFSDGSFTGEVSAKMLKDVGCRYVIVGHCERRRFFCEDNVLIKKQLHQVVSQNICPIVCIGEENADHFKTELFKQLKGTIESIKGPFLLAYEPVWAVGASKALDIRIIQNSISFIQDFLEDVNLSSIPILYGGSVDAKNINLFFENLPIKGVLVGRASCDPISFGELLEKIKSC